jgi:CBS domain-containing protein
LFFLSDLFPSLKVKDLIFLSRKRFQTNLKQEEKELKPRAVSIDSQAPLQQALAVMEKRLYHAIAVTQPGAFFPIPLFFFMCSVFSYSFRCMLSLRSFGKYLRIIFHFASLSLLLRGFCVFPFLFFPGPFLPSPEGRMRVAQQVKGILTEPVFARVIIEKKDLKRVRCCEMMKTVPFATPDSSVDELAITMLEHNLVAMPVVDEIALILDFKHLVSSLLSPFSISLFQWHINSD